MRPAGSPQDLERRRQRAIVLLQEGHSPKEVSERVGVDRRSVRRWTAAFRSGGEKTGKPRAVPRNWFPPKSSIWSISFPGDPRSRDFQPSCGHASGLLSSSKTGSAWCTIPITKNPLANRSPDTVEDLHRSTPLHIQVLREQEDLLRSFLQHSPLFLPETGHY